jgi:hypothetical protein
MNKPFLLIAGYWHSPESGTGDWKKCYASIEEVDGHEDYGGGYCIGKERYDWYTIVDLREWTQ